MASQIITLTFEWKMNDGDGIVNKVSKETQELNSLSLHRVQEDQACHDPPAINDVYCIWKQYKNENWQK